MRFIFPHSSLRHLSLDRRMIMKKRRRFSYFKACIGSAYNNWICLLLLKITNRYKLAVERSPYFPSRGCSLALHTSPVLGIIVESTNRTMTKFQKRVQTLFYYKHFIVNSYSSGLDDTNVQQLHIYKIFFVHCTKSLKKKNYTSI